MIGIARRDNVIDVSQLEFCVREDLNKTAQRVMVVLNPLKVVIDNYPEEQTEELDAINNPEDESMGKRKVPFSKEIYIERDDFMENPPKKYFRLSPGTEVRLRYAYFVKCTEVIKDINGEVIEVHCTYDPASKGGNSPDGRKVQGTIHWVSAKDHIDTEVRLYDRLFIKENPEETEDGHDFKENLNPESLKTITAKAEPFLKNAKHGDKLQFERIGYFCVDKDSNDEKLVINRTVALRDSWNKSAPK
jgi:glutaminyl-tRNA synthetase